MALKRKCLECKIAFKRRSGKRFCSNTCRSRYNRRLLTGETGIVRKTNRILKNNRQILHELFSGKKKPVEITKEKLQKLGFLFDVCTGIDVYENGFVYRCYEYYYLSHDDTVYVVGKTQKVIAK